MNKICNKCGETKPLGEFYKEPRNTGGYSGHCKLCKLTICKVWREANKEQKAASVRAWNQANPDKIKAHYERMKDKWPEKIAARTAVNNAVWRGKLIRQPCEVCGALEVHGHHDDYSKPLEVRWLCPKHHTEHHNQLEQAA